MSKYTSSKNYAKGVSSIREVPFRDSETKLILSAYVPDLVHWLQENCTDDGWININIIPKADKNERRSHNAFLNERLTKNKKTEGE